MQRCLCEVQRLCPGMFDGINPNTPYRWKRSAPRAETLGRRILLSPADTTRLSEHILRMTDVLCLSAVTIRGLVYEWLDAEGLDVRPGKSWVKQLLRGMRLSFKKPAKCLKELHSPALQEVQHAPAVHQAVLAHGQARCQRGPPRRETSSAAGQHQGGHDIHGRQSAWTVARWTCWCKSYTRARQTPSCRSSPGPCTLIASSENGWATTTTILQLAASLDDAVNPSSVDPSLGLGQHPRQRGHPFRHEGRFPTRLCCASSATKHFVLAALRRGRLPQLQERHPDAGERHSCPLRPRWLLRRLGHEQGMAAPVFGRMGSSRSHGPLRREQGLDNWVASIACPQRCPLQRSRRRGRGTPFPRRALLQAHRAGARSRRPRGLGHGRGVRRRGRRAHARRAA